jgi:putative ABC transport system substrate-binding protein
MRRRTLIANIAGAIVWPFTARAQQKKMPVIGYLKEGASQYNANDKAFLRGMSDLGYVEGRNFVLEYRSADGRAQQLPTLAAELVGLKVDVIVTGGGTPAALAAKAATTTVPIVLSNSQSPVDDGLVESLARPGGNITGLAVFGAELSAKRLQLAKEVLPELKRIGIMWNANNPGNSAQNRFTETAARNLGLELDKFPLVYPVGLEEAFAIAVRNGAGAMLVLSDNVSATYAPQITANALKYRLPSIHFSRVYMQSGGGALLSYGPIMTEVFARAATYVDKILKGEKPADLPIEQPTKFELVINLKAAKTLGITIPEALLARADEAIE